MITAITANYNTARFYPYLYSSLVNNTHYLSQILVYDYQNQIVPNSIVNVFQGELKKGSGSESHGEALNYLKEFVETPYVLIIDMDCFVYQQDWDLLFLPLLERYPVIGAEHFRKELVTAKPLLHANFLFTTKEAIEGVDMLPDFENNVDTCGKLSVKYISKYLLEIEHNSKPKYNFTDTECAEYLYNNKPIWYHYGRGGQLRGGESNFKKWEANCNQLLEGASLNP